MFTTLAVLAAAAASFAGVQAQIEPGVGTKFNAGSECSVNWKVDPTGTWKKMYIELMTGNNLEMVHLTTLATVDGTDATKAEYTWTCPEVDPYSQIYFYQFSTPANKQPIWTTRFIIADKDGNSVAPPNSTQPDGKPIGWGIGKLLDQSLVTPAPTDVGTEAPDTTSSSSDSSSAAGSVTGASGATSPTVTPVTGGSSATKSATSSSTSGAVKVASSGASGAANSTTTGTADNGAMSMQGMSALAVALLGAVAASLL